MLTQIREMKIFQILMSLSEEGLFKNLFKKLFSKIKFMESMVNVVQN